MLKVIARAPIGSVHLPSTAKAASQASCGRASANPGLTTLKPHTYVGWLNPGLTRIHKKLD